MLTLVLVVGALTGCGGDTPDDTAAASTEPGADASTAAASTPGESVPGGAGEGAEQAGGEAGSVTVAGTTTTFTGSCQDLRDLSGRLTWFGTGTGPDGAAAELTVSYTLEPPSGSFSVITDDPAAADGQAVTVQGPATTATFDDSSITVAGQVTGAWTNGAVTDGQATVPCPVE